MEKSDDLLDPPAEMEGTDGAFRPVKSAGRVLEVLEELASSGPRPMRDLADHLGVPRSSMHALLRTMQHYGWVETDPTGTLYGLGVRSLLAGSAYVDRDDIVVRTAPVLDTLAEKTGETVHLGRLDGADIVYLSKRESRHPLRLYSAIGRRLPAHATALGKAILSTLDRSMVESLVPPPLERLTANTITDPQELHEELARTQGRRYAVDREENTEGIRCFAVPVPSGHPVQDAISVSVPVFRLDDDREEHITATLLAAAERARAASRRYR
jgi:DNA-binding IclR family transcriptional regulator